MKNDTNHFDYQGRVIEFMKASGQTVNEVPTEMTVNQADLRYKLYLEEVLELREAIMAQDKVESLDAVVDILYITLGTAATIGYRSNSEVIKALEFCESKKGRSTMDILTYLEGLHVNDYDEAIFYTIVLAHDIGLSRDQIQKAFELVHSNNMSKFCTCMEDAIASVQEYSLHGVEAFWQRRGDLYVILRKEDGKVLKGINYKKVVLKDLV